jgi:hypothetical protein
MRLRIQYVMTWVALGVLLTAGLLLMVLSWNGAVRGAPGYVLMALLWICISASGIFLFTLAAKKAHRLMVNEERRLKQVRAERDERRETSKSPSADQHSFDFAATARKLVRRFPEGGSLEASGHEMLKNLARELEIMSGILYIRKRTVFEAVSTYAIASPAGPEPFREGEGLPGQAARNRQIMMVTHFPEEYLKVCSGLGKSEPLWLAIVPLVHKNRTIAVVECSGFRHDPHDIENMFRIFARDLMEKLSPNLK